MLFAAPGGLEALVRVATGGAWHEAFELIRWLGTADLDEHEPFGFADGISQPHIDWTGQRDPRRAHVTYSNVVAPGEFLLGYRNEYAKFTDRPWWMPMRRAQGCCRRWTHPRNGRRPERHLPGRPAAAAGRARVLAVRP